MRLDELWARDKGICHLCGHPVPREQASRDHLIPRSKLRAEYSIEQRRALGESETNVALAHRVCNNKRSDRPLDDTGLFDPQAHPDPRYYFLRARKGHRYCACPCSCKIQIPETLEMTICDTMCRVHYISLI